MRKILIVDDYEGIIKLLEMECRRLRHDHVLPMVCNSVVEVLAQIDNHNPVAMFFDHNLTRGGNEGFEIVRLLVGREILLFSTTSDEDLIPFYLRSGITAHIGKDPRSIIKQIEEVNRWIRMGQISPTPTR